MGVPCTICARPDRPEIDGKINAGVSILTIAREHGLDDRRSSLYRHARAGHAAGAKPPPEMPPAPALERHEPIAETIRKATRLAHAAERHMRKALKSDDLKAANGALSSATKAFELFGKATGQLQSGSKVDVNVTANTQIAVAAHAQAQEMDARDQIDAARALLGAYLEAGDAHAIAAVGELLRMLPSAEATTQPQALTPATSREPDRVITGGGA